MSESVTSGAHLMPLGRALDNLGLQGVALKLALLVQTPGAWATKPETHVHKCEFHLRRYLRGEAGPHLEKAIARLLVCALASKVNHAE
jgi:hypothetical protein